MSCNLPKALRPDTVHPRLTRQGQEGDSADILSSALDPSHPNMSPNVKNQAPQS